MPLPHPEFEHGRSAEYVANALAILEPGIATGLIYNARYNDAKFYAGRAFYDERSAMRDIDRPDHGSPIWRKWWALLDAMPFELTHLQTIERKLAAAIKQNGIDLGNPLLKATNDRILRFQERWKPMHHMIREGKPLVVKGREPSSEPRSTLDRTFENTGTCSCCDKNVKLEDGKGVDHGFQISANSRQGSCFGVGYEPFEVSPKGAVDFIAHLQQRETREEAYLERLKSPDLDQVTDVNAWPPKTYKKGDPGFSLQVKYAIGRTNSEISSIRGWIKMYSQKVEDWKPMPLPDGKRDHMPAVEDTQDAGAPAPGMR